MMTETPTARLRGQVGTVFTIKGTPWVVAPQGDKRAAVRNGIVWLVRPERVGQEPLGGELWPIALEDLARMYTRGEVLS